MKKIFEIISLFLGVLLSIGTKFIFTPCQHNDGTLGNCNISQHYIFIVGVIIVVFSLICIFLKQYKVCMFMNIMIFIEYLVAFLLPNFIIGVCASKHMMCLKLMLPAVNIITILGMILTIINIIRIGKNNG